MARSIAAKLHAALIALTVAFVPQSGSAQMSVSDLADLRATLVAVETEVRSGLDAPADVAAIWARLAVGDAQPGAVAFGAIDISVFENARAALPAPSAAPEMPATGAKRLFSLQMAQTSSVAPAIVPTPAPTPARTPLFGALANNPTTRSDTDAPQDVDVANFRMMLATLAQSYTGQNSMAVVNAQGPRGPQAISVRAGTVSLADIQSYATAFGMPPLPDGTLTAPVIVWPGATLRLRPGDRMALARDTGAFVLSLGTLDIDGATIEVAGTENIHTPSFVPFVTVAGEGTLLAKRATFRGLGFGQTAKFSGVSVARGLLGRNEGKVVIEDSLFDGLLTLTVFGGTGARITGNTFINARDNTLRLANAPDSLVQNNLFTGGSHTNAIRVEKGSADSALSRNIFLSGHRVAMRITDASDGVKVQDNLVWKRDGAGVKFLNTRCGLVQGNYILDNRQKGVEVRKSDGTYVRGNIIAGNGSAGIWVSAQQADARTVLSENTLIANGSGLSTATAAEIRMDGNDFTGQLPRLLDGDITALSRSVITDLRGTQALWLKDGVAHAGRGAGDICGVAR